MRILVVGQGLAGTLISHAALREGWDCHVIDSGSTAASSVAAGMFNPMSFRRILEVWDAAIHLDALNNTYREMERDMGTELLHFLPILKRIPNASYAEDWNKKAEQLPWIEPVLNDSQIVQRYPDAVKSDGHGFGIVNGGGWVNVPKLILAWRSRLQHLGRFSIQQWHTADAQNGLAASWDAIVDCRGCAVTRDQTAPGPDIRSNRGEILTLGSPTPLSSPPPRSHILNFGKWTLPVAPNQWRLGASYEWNRTDLNPTPETARFLMETLENNAPECSPLDIQAHDVGERPVSRDRRPAVGPWPEIDGLYLFNGLGTRGVLIGPRWANYLIETLKGESQCVDIVAPKRLFFSH